jgi:hypothetical protein
MKQQLCLSSERWESRLRVLIVTSFVVSVQFNSINARWGSGVEKFHSSTRTVNVKPNARPERRLFTFNPSVNLPNSLNEMERSTVPPLPFREKLKESGETSTYQIQTGGGERTNRRNERTNERTNERKKELLHGQRKNVDVFGCLDSFLVSS